MTFDQDPAITADVLSILRLLRPHDVAGYGKNRLGRPNDGGYVMVDDLQGIDAAYSIGINDDVSWDADMAERGIEIFQYDHTIESAPPLPGATWRRIGLGAETDPAANLRSLPDMLSENGHAASRDLILKCDVEGAELWVFSKLPDGFFSRFRQIVIEMHCFEAFHLPDFRAQIRAAITRLTEFHHVVHVHGNNSAPLSVIGGVPIPNVFELTLLRKDAGEFVHSDLSFPTAMDQPCNRDRADYYLGRFTFD
ncbi:MAG: hypothetical protein JWL91_1594 [Sphingomonas bacterium]|nr:hypothetical protein [Sphingomonas bacterium]MDB5689718.1 hypothetical protein [Sphingomonas bacterium]